MRLRLVIICHQSSVRFYSWTHTHRRAVMSDWGTNPAKGLFFARFEYIRDSPTPRQSGITVVGQGVWNKTRNCFTPKTSRSTFFVIKKKLCFWHSQNSGFIYSFWDRTWEPFWESKIFFFSKFDLVLQFFWVKLTGNYYVVEIIP